METGKLKSMIIAAIGDGVELKRNGKVITNARLLKFTIRTATPCSNPNYNCTFTGDADIAIIVPTENGDDRKEFPGCEIEGNAMVSNDSAKIINGISVKRGLSLINS